MQWKCKTGLDELIDDSIQPRPIVIGIDEYCVCILEIYDILFCEHMRTNEEAKNNSETR